MAEFDEILAQFNGIRGFLFDLDGTLADTMEVHCQAYRNVISRLGGTLTSHDYFALVGPPARVTIPLFLRAGGLPDADASTIAAVHQDKKDEFDRLITKQPPALLPAGALLKRCAGQMAIAVVTSANRDGATAVLEALRLSPLINALVTSDDVTQGKPHPEPYAKALDLLSLDKQQALAFEDHDQGIASALAAGLSVIDVRKPRVIQPHDKL